MVPATAESGVLASHTGVTGVFCSLPGAEPVYVPKSATGGGGSAGEVSTGSTLVAGAGL